MAASDAPPAADSDAVSPPDFAGSVRTDNTIPTAATLQRTAELPVLDREGKQHAFQSLYAQPGQTLVVFVRHFFCGVGLHRTPWPATLSPGVSVC